MNREKCTFCVKYDTQNAHVTLVRWTRHILTAVNTDNVHLDPSYTVARCCHRQIVLLVSYVIFNKWWPAFYSVIYIYFMSLMLVRRT